MPKRYKANFVPRLPPALAAFCIGSMSLSLHIRRLLSAFPHVTTAFVVRASTVPCFSPNPNSLHLLGVSITTLLHIMDPAAPWGLGKLDVSLPSNATRRELRDLVTAIVDRCASLSHLKIGLDFDQPGRWIITRRLFTKLSHLQRLTHLDIEAPMRSHMSDDDWKAAVQPWPLLERLRIVPRTPRPCAYPSLSRRPYPTPSSTIQVVFDIATACPRLVTLGLPGIDCTRVSCWEPPRRSSPLFSPLSSLCIFESPVIDHGSLGRLLSQRMMAAADLSRLEDSPTVPRGGGRRRKAVAFGVGRTEQVGGNTQRGDEEYDYLLSGVQENTTKHLCD
ncbi:hypothetical protein EV121DRAFT_274822 [Schizophyllum commune]